MAGGETDFLVVEPVPDILDLDEGVVVAGFSVGALVDENCVELVLTGLGAEDLPA